MAEEKRLILEMLKDGKISSEEAKELLAVLGEEESNDESDNGAEYQHQNTSHDNHENESGWSFFSGLKDLLSFNALTGPTHEFVEEYTHIFTSDKVIADIKTRSGSVKIKGWDKEECFIKVIKKIKGIAPESKARDFAQSYNVLRLENSSIETEDYKNKHLNVSYEINLPKSKILNLKTSSVNGKVELKDITIDQCRLNSVNGKTLVEEVKGDSIKVSGVNGVIDINGDFANITCSTVNGKIVVKDSNVEEGSVKLSTVNGPIKIELPSGASGVRVKSSSVNGRCNVEHKNLRITSQSGKYTNKRIEAQSDGEIKRSYDISAVNGTLTVTELV